MVRQIPIGRYNQLSYERLVEELASGSEDEKRLKKAKEAASRKRKQTAEGRRGNEKRFKGPSTSTNLQIFRGGREASRGFRCFQLGHWARDCNRSWAGTKQVYRGTGFTPGYFYSSYKPYATPYATHTPTTIRWKAERCLRKKLLILHRNLIECTKRTRSHPAVSKKKPVDADIIRGIIDRYGAEGASSKDLRTAAICTLDFAGFFRFNQ
ncbi:hypothetical protein ACROYT_G025701 [Oculina patagonica]